MPPKCKKPSKKLKELYFPAPNLQDVRIRKKKDVVRQYFIPAKLIGNKMQNGYWVNEHPWKAKAL